MPVLGHRRPGHIPRREKVDEVIWRNTETCQVLCGDVPASGAVGYKNYLSTAILQVVQTFDNPVMRFGTIVQDTPDIY